MASETNEANEKKKPEKKSREEDAMLRPIDDLRLPTRPETCLLNAGVTLVGELVQKGERELRRLPNLGEKSLDEIKTALASRGLTLGMRVFHGKFGYGTIEVIEGNKLEIDFEHGGRKRVLDSFVSLG